MNKTFIKVIKTVFAIYIGLGLVAFAGSDAMPVSAKNIIIDPVKLDKLDNEDPIVFKHGDISWLPNLATRTGWPKKTWKRLGFIILRESGGCPNRFGGSIVDENCNIIGHDGSDHRSDSGLLQINTRANLKFLCTSDLKICTKEQLMEPINNLLAGRLLYEHSGWAPWDVCQWGPAYAARCKATPPMP